MLAFLVLSIFLTLGALSARQPEVKKKQSRQYTFNKTITLICLTVADVVRSDLSVSYRTRTKDYEVVGGLHMTEMGLKLGFCLTALQVDFQRRQCD